MGSAGSHRVLPVDRANSQTVEIVKQRLRSRVPFRFLGPSVLTLSRRASTMTDRQRCELCQSASSVMTPPLAPMRSIAKSTASLSLTALVEFCLGWYGRPCMDSGNMDSTEGMFDDIDKV